MIKLIKKIKKMKNVKPAKSVQNTIITFKKNYAWYTMLWLRLKNNLKNKLNKEGKISGFNVSGINFKFIKILV